jgi:tetratricopeptide (TPR) repeat protein
VAAGAFLATPVLAQQATVESPAAVTLYVTSASEEANTHFWMAIDEWENIRGRVAAEHFDRALSIDPNFGLARVMQGFVTPGLQQEERASRIERGLVQLAGASAAELTLATAFKEWAAGNVKTARTLLSATAELTPGDRHVAYMHAVAALNVDQPAGLQALQKVAQRFPDFAPPQNILAYTLWNTGDREGGVRAVRKYVELVPDHPNPYDSYGELLQWDGRFEDAAQQYRNAIQRDPAFAEAYMGLAEIARLTGRTADIPGLIEQAIQYAPTPQARINARRALANHYLMQRNGKAAMTQLATAAQEAAENDFDRLTAVAYRQMALADAMYAKGANVEKHLQAAADVDGPDTPAQHAWATWAYAAAKKMDMARTHAQQLEKKADAANWKTASRTANALLYLYGNDTEQAFYQLEQADPANIVVRALMADCYKRMGRKAEARTLKDEVMNDRTVDFYNAMVPIAMAHVSQM